MPILWVLTPVGGGQRFSKLLYKNSWFFQLSKNRHSKKAAFCLHQQLIMATTKTYCLYYHRKHCQRHNGPEGWVHLSKVTSWSHIKCSYTNPAQISFWGCGGGGGGPLPEEEACQIVDINIKYNKFWAQSIILSSVAWVGRLIEVFPTFCKALYVVKNIK